MSWRLAAAQMSARLGAVDQNLEDARRMQRAAAEAGADLVVLPEAILTGYAFDSFASAHRAAVRMDGPEVALLSDAAVSHGLCTVFGFVELVSDRIYNTAMLIEPTGERHIHRKSHLPCLGVDRFVSRERSPAPSVVCTKLGRIGLSICYEMRFPEVARCLALAGADVIVQPMNVTAPARVLIEDFARVRAAENSVYLAVANRADREGEAEFVGGSRVIGPDGTVLAEAERTEDLVIAEIDVTRARSKHLVRQPGRDEIDIFADRRPELYGALTSP